MDSNDNRFNLTDEEQAKLLQFRELTQMEDELKCVQILRLNDWNLETAIPQTLDGAYQAASTSYPEQESITSLRQRHISNMNSSHNSDVDNSIPEGEPPHEDTNEQQFPSLSLIIWKAASGILYFPFLITMKTLKIVYDFFSTMIMPSLNIDSSGTVSRHVDEFIEKYGNVHPNFNRMKFDDVLKLAKREICFVLVYIHSPTHRDTDRFCREFIATRKFVDYLQNRQIIFWSCSVTYPEGYRVFQQFRGSKFPFLALFGLQNNRMAMLKRLESLVNVDAFLTELQHAVGNFEISLVSARLEKEQRSMDNQLRQQQDIAFQESLRADQEKARKKQEEEIIKAENDRIKLEQEEKKRLREEKIKEMKSTLLRHLSEEPDDVPEAIRIMFRLPGGKKLERRFWKHDPIRFLYYFVFCNDKTLVNFKLHTNFPKIDLPGRSPSPDDEIIDGMNLQLKECDLGNNIVLFVYDLDS